MTTENSTHALTTLTGVIKRSVVSLRHYSEELRQTPSQLLLSRCLDEATTLSTAVSALSKQIDISTLDVVNEHAAPTVDVDAIFDVMDRVRRYEAHGPCCVCGGTLPDLD